MREKHRTAPYHPAKQRICFTAGILCILYGAIVCLTGANIRFSLIWIAGGLLLLLLGAAIRRGLTKKIPRPLILAFRGAVILGLLILIAFQTAVFSHFADEEEPDLDLIIVLGAYAGEDGPGLLLRQRLDEAARYLDENPHTRCVVTGGQGTDEPRPEASTMAEYLIERGIARDRVILEEKSTSTAENIRFSLAFFDPDTDRIGIVTSDFHLFRALCIARRQGLVHVCGIAAPSPVFYLPNNCLREFLAAALELAGGDL